MGILQFFAKKELSPLSVSDEAIVAPADGKIIDIATVSDPVFAEKKLGDSIAFRYSKSSVTLCAPANGTLSVLFPTGHAFGIVMKNGTEILVHCGVDTVEAKGDGFTICGKKQGDLVAAGDPIVTVDIEKLNAKYDMSTMLILTKNNGEPVVFKEPGPIVRGESVFK